MVMEEKKKRTSTEQYLFNVDKNAISKKKWNESALARALPTEKKKQIKRASSSPSTSQCRDLLSFVYAKMFRIFVVKHDFSIFV